MRSVASVLFGRAAGIGWRGLCRCASRIAISFMGLPNAKWAEVDLRKLADYCLSPMHPVGRHKAAVFRAALGLTAADAQMLRERILLAAIDGQAIAGQTTSSGIDTTSISRSRRRRHSVEPMFGRLG